jgi:glycosyltransferase involved in cell wall biosynthesis
VNCRLVPTKKVDLLIKAFNKIAKNHPEIKKKKLKILGQ